MQPLAVPYAAHLQPLPLHPPTPPPARTQHDDTRFALDSSFDNASAIAESRVEKDIRVGEDTLFEQDDDELYLAEPPAEQRANVSRVREVQRCVDLVEDVHRRGRGVLSSTALYRP